MKRLWHVVWPWRSPAPPPARCPTSLVPSPSSSTTSVSSPAISSPINSPQTTVMITRGRCNVDFCSCLQGRFSSAGGSIEDTPCTRCPHEFSQHGTNREIYPMPQEPIINNNWSMRTAVTSELLRRLLHYQILYVRGTPASGKSVLLNLLHQQLCVQCPALKVISIVSWPKAMNVLQSRNYLEQLLGCSLSKVTMIPPTVLLVDEAQTTKDDEYFWNTFLKFIVQPDDTPLLVCLFATYGSAGSNPVEIPSITPPVLSCVQRVELQWYGTDVDQAVGLYLSREEADEIFDKTTSYHQDRPIYGVDFRDYVYAVTSGHAGALTSIIREVTKHRVYIITMRCLEECIHETVTGHQKSLHSQGTSNNQHFLRTIFIP
ncbi:hypothetical protein K440DRAFT_321623 [Wilcoxina mikolae CBS 423.85]|nr:hypothetical protein K440DRAFT_321623 [Wilcoxina mikolae CBS 423.85]